MLLHRQNSASSFCPSGRGLLAFLSLICLLIGLAMGMAALSPAFAEDSHTPLEPIDCPKTLTDDAGMACFFLHVPADWSNLSHNPIKLPVIRFAPLGDKVTKPPLLILAGGPGQSTIFLAKGIAKNLRSFRKDRELILMDQRGTGPLAGDLLCEEALGKDDRIDAEKIVACAAKLKDEGTFITHYGTPSAVEDYRALRYALRIDRWAIMATSYGARVAQGLIERDSKGIDRIIFNAPLLYQVNLFDWDPNLLVEEMVDLCNEREDCRSNFPNLYWSYQALPFAMREAKLAKEQSPAALQPYLYSQRLQALLSRHRGGELPLDIVETYRAVKKANNNAEIWTPPSPLPQSMKKIGLMMHFAIVCTEEIDRLDGIGPLDLKQPLRVAFYRGACERLREAGIALPKQKKKWFKGSKSKLPLLIFNGTLDAVVDPESPKATRSLYPNATLMTFAFAGHDIISRYPCARKIALDFLNGVSNRQLNTGCIENRGISFPTLRPKKKMEKPQS